MLLALVLLYRIQVSPTLHNVDYIQLENYIIYYMTVNVHMQQAAVYTIYIIGDPQTRPLDHPTT